MIRSMTGFGRGDRTANGWQCCVELRSVNSRYLEVRFKLPTGLGHLEENLKAIIKNKCDRGKIECSVALSPENPESGALAWNELLMRQYGGLLKKAEELLGTKVEVTLGNLVTIKDLLQADSLRGDEEAVADLITETLDEATNQLVAMREREGQAMKEIMEQHLNNVRTQLKEIKPLSDKLPEHFAERLRENVAKLTPNGEGNQERLLQEIALMADRYDVAEEINRFGAHLVHLDQMMGQGGALGRKFDFLLQEINREANTLAAKCNDAEISGKVVEIKSELEKMREQIQNIE